MLGSLIDLLVGPSCACCGTRTGEDMSADLARNLDAHGIGPDTEPRVAPVCRRCFERRRRARCLVTSRVFARRDDRLPAFLGRTSDQLAPFHRLSRLTGHLSPEGLPYVEAEHALFQKALRAFRGGSRRGTLPGMKVVKHVGRIRTIGRHGSIAAVEDQLTLFAVQHGANAYLDFHWQRHVDVEEERYVAGHGPQGNPYYRTRRSHEESYAGHATAVVVEERGGDRSRTRKRDDGRPSAEETMGERLVRLRGVLDLRATYTREELVSAYRRRMREYHPDRVQGLGADLLALAKRRSQQINEAYDALMQRFR